MFPVALQLYSVRSALADDFEGTLCRIAEAGYRGVEFAGLHGKSFEEAGAALRRAGLLAVSAHLTVAAIEEDPTILAGYASLGMKHVAISGHPFGSEPFAVSAARIRAAALAARAVGLSMHFHNHTREFFLTEEGRTVMEALLAFDEGLLGAEFDTGWVTVAGESPADWLCRYRGRVPLVHLKDFTFEKDGKEEKKNPPDLAHAVLGNGRLDVAAVVAAAQSAGTEWLIVEHDEPEAGKTAEETCRQSFAYLNTLNK